jgi:hypothetical protein
MQLLCWSALKMLTLPIMKLVRGMSTISSAHRDKSALARRLKGRRQWAIAC